MDFEQLQSLSSRVVRLVSSVDADFRTEIHPFEASVVLVIDSEASDGATAEMQARVSDLASVVVEPEPVDPATPMVGRSPAASATGSGPTG